MEKTRKIKRILTAAAVAAVFLAVFTLLNALVRPKYAEDLVEGGMISEYYDDIGGHDVIFIGDCEVYSNISPMEMYRTSGITAYVRGTSQQLIWQSYYVLEETLGYETPRAVVLNVNAMRYSEPVKEEYNRMAMDKMRWSPSKVGMIFASMTEEENFWSYVFPILRYHSRITELKSEDFTYLFGQKSNTWNGYLMTKSVKPLETLPARRKLPDYSFSDGNFEYLDRMLAKCREKGVELVLMKAPSAYPFWYDEYDQQIEEYAEKNGIKFYNFLDYLDEIGIDYSTDTYDSGLHLNLAGATKLSRFAAEALSRDLELPDRRQDPELSAEYEARLAAYDGAAFGKED